MFDLVSLDDELITAHLAEGPGSFIQATMFYRDKFCKKNISKNDKYYAVTLHSDSKHIPKMETSFIEYYKKEKPVRFNLHKTYSKEQSRQSKIKDNGDLTNQKTIKLFGGNFDKQKAHFITADGGFDWENENIQEQEAFKLILSQIITALKIQAKNGNFVCKFYETFSETSTKLISILMSFYSEVYLVKPLMSRTSNSEKYAVCLKFKDMKDKNKRIDKLDNILEQMNNTDLHIVNLFPKYTIDKNIKSILININLEISNKQFVAINSIVDFIAKQNYRGDEYTKRRQLQIDASKFWLSLFFPDTKDLNDTRNKVINMINQIVDSTKIRTDELQKQLEF